MSKRSIPFEKFLFILVGVALLASSFGAGYYSGIQRKTELEKVASLTNKEADKPGSVDFSAFWKAWNLLDEKYVPAHAHATTTDQDKVWGAIQGLASSYGDPYTVFFPPAEKSSFDSQVSGNFEGIGMEVGVKDGIVSVVAPLKGSPAEKAGMKAGDLILKINGGTTAELSIDKAVSLIRGPKGTTVTLNVLREGRKDPFDVKIVRDTIDLPTIDTEKRTDGVFVIRLYGFTATSPDLFRDALQEFIASGDSKLIVDLRGNPGGYLDAAVGIGSYFLPQGDVVVRERSGSAPEQIFRSQGLATWADGFKMAVLMDGGSASASEILAGALQENGIAKLIGEKSFGKGSVQEVVPVTDDTSLKVTVARWYTPNGISISDSGLKPDISVKPKPSDKVGQGTDAQEDRAAAYLVSGK